MASTYNILMTLIWKNERVFTRKQSVFSLTAMLKCSKPFYATAHKKRSYYLTGDTEIGLLRNHTCLWEPLQALFTRTVFKLLPWFFFSLNQLSAKPHLTKKPMSIHNYKSSIPVHLSGSSLSDVIAKGKQAFFFFFCICICKMNKWKWKWLNAQTWLKNIYYTIMKYLLFIFLAKKFFRIHSDV